jgi:hypothetical protein
MKGYSRQPYSGNPTVRDENGGHRKRGYNLSGKTPINMGSGDRSWESKVARLCSIQTII